MIRLFPYLLCRLGGDSLSLIQPIREPALADLSSQRTANQQARQLQKHQLSAALLHEVQQAEGGWQKQLHNFRRALYNEQPVKADHRSAVLLQLSPSLIDQLLAYEKLIQAQGELERAWETCYSQHLVANRVHLQRLSQHEGIRQGLVLSSPDLLDKLAAYEACAPDSLRKRESHLEISFLKYLSRTVTKTSPFSTFTNLTTATLVESQQKTIQITPDCSPTGTVVGHVRLNNHLYHLLRNLIWQYKPIFNHVGIQVNPTLRTEQGQWLYLTNFNNIESFQRITSVPVLEAILDHLEETKVPVTLETLVTHLGELVNADPDALTAYLRQLLEVGFLEPVWPSSGVDPNWDMALVHWLLTISQQNVPNAQPLADALMYLRQQAERFGTQHSPVRQRLLSESHERIRAVFWQIHEAAGLPANERRPLEDWLKDDKQLTADKQHRTDNLTPKKDQPFRYRPTSLWTMRAKQLFFEDTTRSVAVTVDQKTLTDWAIQFNHLNSYFGDWYDYDAEQDRLLSFIREHYQDQSSIPLLTIYEDYYRQVLLPAELQKQQLETDEELPAKEALTESISPVTPADRFIHALQSFFQTQISQTGDVGHVSIVDQELDLMAMEVGVRSQPDTDRSVACFVQFYEQSGRFIGVINKTVPGWGKFFSRFLHILNPDVLTAQREWNGKYAGGRLLLETMDASFFNANLHPPLMPDEIQIPNGHSSLPPSALRPVADFHLTVLPDQRLQLVYQPTQTPAYCFDLGFQGPAGRSPLFRLLTHFGLPSYGSAYPLVQAANQAALSQQQQQVVKQYPRIVYNQCIVLQRHHWRFSRADTPIRQPLETDAAFAWRIRNWCHQYGLPNQVFVVINEEVSELGPANSSQKFTRDDYKPQYIDFEHPQLVLLFEKLMAKGGDSYRIEEMLPTFDQAVTIGNQPFVSECLLQVYTTL